MARVTRVVDSDTPESSDVIRSAQAESIEPYSAADKKQWLANLPEEFLLCRVVMHAWNVPLGFHDTKVNGRKVKQMNLICDRCATEKDARIRIKRVKSGNTVDRDSVAMHYPEGYLAPSGMYITKNDAWSELARRRKAIRKGETAEAE